jgi:hypothetical protein
VFRVPIRQDSKNRKKLKAFNHKEKKNIQTVFIGENQIMIYILTYTFKNKLEVFLTF